MPVFRQGDVPHPPTGLPEHSDEIYTQRGFFGYWVHIFRRHNAGVPKRWSSDDVMYAGIDANVLVPSDLNDPNGTPMCLLEGDGIRVLLSRRSQPMPFCEKNTDFNQIRFYHRGTFEIDTELGPFRPPPVTSSSSARDSPSVSDPRPMTTSS